MIYLGGVDEVGRGPLAGPVTACCVVLKPEFNAEKLTDSKEISPKLREEYAVEIRANALALSVVSVGPRRIEELNIRQASILAMQQAISRVGLQLQLLHGSADFSFFILSDGNMSLESKYPNEPIVKGDKCIKVISAASIVAKVVRDDLAQKLDKLYPGYGISSHKGYATAFHREAVSILGPCRIHRSFAAAYIEQAIPSVATINTRLHQRLFQFALTKLRE